MLKIIFRLSAICVIVYFLFVIFKPDSKLDSIESKKFENLPELKIADVIFKNSKNLKYINPYRFRLISYSTL
ncbi:hypothetical protein DCO58_11195 [Helicobacter saguini]|uniref:Uncharacterized protein n=1 Tax=Helicobacter saguini TaxID=1548018 RepID=A0A347VQ00_9HELI|nr:hypothetical protein [Helicobacter saguini]MWV61139.1 hypothetical protein [Helicobacter saguini]MWV68192.1 hypothetical protein [Helicobacter saguini]MWV70344.1 hypothetical protein [Helicobacter saguini]MWV72246.1 hypothetical protein [Helicobacter saguini]TLD95292.1 hypothetical protein LS64_002780 [Helicobacter saguini]